MYEIVDAPDPHRISKYGTQIRQLHVGNGFLVPWEDLSYSLGEAGHTVRSTAWFWSKKLGIRLATKKEKRGVWIIRRA
jgi:hypothetical protein